MTTLGPKKFRKKALRRKENRPKANKKVSKEESGNLLILI
jgi:hypothetical protein